MILLNDFRRQWKETRERAIDTFVSVGESGWYILGERVAEFEAALANCWGAEHAVGVASGLDALEIALTVAGCRRGDKVLTTPLSAFATTLSVLKLGAVPVFVDTDAYGLIDLTLCRATLQARPDIRFMVPVHLFGNALDLLELRRIRDEFGVEIIEDCAQSIQATFDGQPTGSVGRLAATSFYPTKNLGAMGDGGAILSSDLELCTAARALRDYGQTAKYQHDRVGYNSRLDELQAALLGAVYLPELQKWTARRREIASRYLTRITNPAIRCLGSPSKSLSNWHLFPVLVDPERKQRFMAYLTANSVGCGEHYPALIPCQRALANQQFEVVGECEQAGRICASEVSLPIHPYLTDDEVEQVIDACNAWEV